MTGPEEDGNDYSNWSLAHLVKYAHLVHSYSVFTGKQFDDLRLLSNEIGVGYKITSDKDSTKEGEAEETWNGLGDLKQKGESSPTIITDPEDDEKLKSKVYEFCQRKIYNYMDRFACKICEKQFKGHHYVEKHIMNKHNDEI